MVALLVIVCIGLGIFCAFLWNCVEELSDRLDVLETTLENHGIYDDVRLR